MSWFANLILIPPPHTRGPLNLHSFFCDLLAPALCYYATAILVIIPNTFLIRLALLPVSLWLAFRGATQLDLTLGYNDNEKLVYLNQGLVLGFTMLAMRVIVWTFQSKPYRRVRTLAEATPGFYNNQAIPTLSGPKQIAADALDLCFNLRGCGWNWSRYLQIPSETRPVNTTAAFSTATCISLALHLISFDLLHYTVQWFSPSTIGSAKGGSIFDSQLPPVGRYLRSSAATFLSGLVIYSAIQTLYLITTLFGVLIFRQHPSLWPPAFKSPWLSTSLTEFWAGRWHQLFRDIFLTLGGIPLSFLAGRVGGVLGAFLVSGVFHYIGLWGMGRGTEFWNVAGFFIINGTGVILEQAWRKISGKRVRGWSGRVWAYLWIISWANVLVDAWARKGLVGSIFLPQHLRPSTYVFGPLA